MITLRILYLGPARDYAQTESESVALPEGATILDLSELLKTQHSRLAGALPTIRFAVNEDFATDATVLADHDEVALIPPVSGGEEIDGVRVDLVRKAIRTERVRAFVAGDRAVGGVVTFEGTTRAESDPHHGNLLALEYEAYEDMARRQLERIAREAAGRWSLRGVAIVHRLGRVSLSETSVLIAVAAGHRAEAFDACRWLMDTLKRDVPIWKKDVFEDGHTRWVESGPMSAGSKP